MAPNPAQGSISQRKWRTDLCDLWEMATALQKVDQKVEFTQAFSRLPDLPTPSVDNVPTPLVEISCHNLKDLLPHSRYDLVTPPFLFSLLQPPQRVADHTDLEQHTACSTSSVENFALAHTHTQQSTCNNLQLWHL